MSPAANPLPKQRKKVTPPPPYQRPNIFIYGVGAEYPPHSIKAEELDTLARRFYSSPVLDKVLAINAYTGIDSRSSIGTIEHPIVNAAAPPTIDQLSSLFLDHGVRLSVAAARQALSQWGGDLDDITHVVSTTCTNSANPGFDHYVVKELGIEQSVEKVLLHGVGCSGGMAALRTAAGLVMGSSWRGRRARVLVLACEISTTFVRSELESIVEDGEVRIGVCLFSDCASAVVVGNGVEDGVDGDEEEEPLLEMLGWEHRIVPETEGDLGFDVHPLGWKVVLTQRVPSLTCSAVPKVFESLVHSVPELVEQGKLKAHDYDWALHPGGATILSGVEKAMGLTPEHMRASYEIYMGHGNSSSATWFSVLKRMLEGDTSEHIIGSAFGPGISIEMAAFKRLRGRGDGSGSGSGSSNGSGSGSRSPAETLVAEDVD